MIYPIKIFDGHPDSGGKLREVISSDRAEELFYADIDPKAVERKPDWCFCCGAEYMARVKGKQRYCPDCDTQTKRRRRNGAKN